MKINFCGVELFEESRDIKSVKNIEFISENDTDTYALRNFSQLIYTLIVNGLTINVNDDKDPLLKIKGLIDDDTNNNSETTTPETTNETQE